MNALRFACFCVLGLSCGCASTPVRTHGTSPTAMQRTLWVIAADADPRQLALPDEDDRIVVRSEAVSRETVSAALERARQQAMAFEHDAALATLSEAQVRLEAAAVEAQDFDQLHMVLAYRSLVESNLGRADRARAALRAAAQIRPEATLDPVHFPPDLCALYASLVSEARAEPPAALAVTSDPTGASMRLNGQPAGTTPGTVHAVPGNHHLRIEAFGYAPRSLALELNVHGNRPLHVMLPPGDRDTVATQLASLDAHQLAALPPTLRTDLADRLDAARVVLLRVPDNGAEDGLEVLALDLRSERTHHATLPAERAIEALQGWDDSAAPADESAGGLWRSPWLWGAVGLVAVGAGVLTYGLMQRQPGTVLRLGTAP